jgi:hypothetical protein
MTYMLYNGFLAGATDLAGAGIGLIGTVLGGRAGGIVGAIGNATGGSGTVIAGLMAADAWRDPTTWLSFWITILAVLILLYTIVRLVLRLLNCYLTIIFLTISSPFVFLVSALPGRQGMATDWVRNMLCNVLSFPAVIAVFYFSAFLVGNNQIPGFGVSQPFNLEGASANLPFLGGFQLENLRKIIAFVALLATPSIPDIICKTVGKPGQGAGVLAGAVSGAISGGQRYQGQISGQVQKATTDVGTWKGSLFGKKQYPAGRIGAIQTRLSDVDQPTDPNLELSYVGDPNLRPNTTIGRIRRGLERIRMADPVNLPQSPYQVHAEGGSDKNKRRSGYG